MMHCPKCRYEQADENIECEKCGIVFNKYMTAQEAKSHGQDQCDVSSNASTWEGLQDILLYTKPDTSLIFIGGRFLVLIFLIFLSIKFLDSPIKGNSAGESFLHFVNLPFHEAGHIIFRPFGSFIASLGGTLGQLSMPLVCFVTLLFKTRDTFGSSVAMWWFGQNFFDMAPYIDDARSRSLPLLGGNTGLSAPYGFHDWEYLLTESGLLHYDHLLAKIAVSMGIIVCSLSILWGGILLSRQYRNIR